MIGTAVEVDPVEIHLRMAAWEAAGRDSRRDGPSMM